jgi:Lipocalin-like domain
MNSEILGAWQLVSASSSTSDGERSDTPFGVDPTGFITYTPDGRMSAIISHGGRKPLFAAGPTPPTTEQQAQAFSTFVAYAGRYTLKSEEVVHHVDISFIQDWVGTDQVRKIKLEGDRLVLSTPPMSTGGKIMTIEFIWQRMAAPPR